MATRAEALGGQLAAAEAGLSIPGPARATGGQEPPRQWRGNLLAPKLTQKDAASCVYATCCPCFAVGETYQRAFNTPKWMVIVHGVVWFFGMSAMWIAAAAINGQCARLNYTPIPFPPPTVTFDDLDKLRASNWTTGEKGKNLAPVFSNATATAAYAARVDAAYRSIAAFGLCNARLSPTVGGVFILTLATLCYGAIRRAQIRQRFNITGGRAGDWAAWLFCTQCAVCQEYRTMRVCRVEDGVWGGKLSWLLDGDAPVQTTPPAGVQMGYVQM